MVVHSGPDKAIDREKRTSVKVMARLAPRLLERVFGVRRRAPKPPAEILYGNRFVKVNAQNARRYVRNSCHKSNPDASCDGKQVRYFAGGYEHR